MGGYQEGSFSANTQVNPKEKCKAIINKSGRNVGLSDREKNNADERKLGQEGSIEKKLSKETMVEEGKNKEEKNK